VLNIDWEEDYAGFHERVRKETYNYLEEPVQKNADKFFESFLGTKANFNFLPRFIHRDLSGDAHILCDAKSDRIVGIIDWEDACIGDPAIDFTGILWDCGEAFTDKVCGHYESLGGIVDGTFRKRNAFYRKIGYFHTILYGLETGSADYVRKGVLEITSEFGD
jgi:aminoglycoside phosphotransferase (APT) family kinase protein